MVDLGCAPGGWTQVAVARVNALGERKGRPVGRVLGIDLLPVDAIPGAELHAARLPRRGRRAAVRELLGGPADVVLSDMAAPASGHPQTDHLRITALVEAAADFAMDVLEPGGSFVAKVLAGGADAALVKRAAPRLRQGAAREAAGEPQGLVREVPRGDRLPDRPED